MIHTRERALYLGSAVEDLLNIDEIQELNGNIMTLREADLPTDCKISLNEISNKTSSSSPTTDGSQSKISDATITVSTATRQLKTALGTDTELQLCSAGRFSWT